MQGYEQYFTGVVYRVQTGAGYLRVAGPDRAAFLQRQTTNDINLRQPGRVLPTVLISPNARILDALYLLPESQRDTEIFSLVTLPGQAEKTFQFFKSRIFFMDKVSLLNETQAFAQVDVMGSRAGEILQSIGLAHPLDEYELADLQIAGYPVQAFKHFHALGLGYRLVIPHEGAERVYRALESQGAAPLSEEGYEALRIEAGLPAAGAELVDEYTPLEAGLEGAISGSKGCYTGQEVIARQMNFDKVTRRMVGLSTSAPVQPGEQVLAEGKAVGTITSAAVSPHLGPLALAIVRRPHHQPGEHLQVGADTPALVCALPFNREEMIK